MPTGQSSLEFISYHAVTRYVQRVLGLGPIACPADATAREVAGVHCAALNQTIASVRWRMMTPAIAIGRAFGGLHSVRHGGYYYTFSAASGVMVTVQPIPRKASTREFSAQEQSKIGRRDRLRNKRRPSPSWRSL